MMNVILQEDVPNLGVVGDLVRVKDGYGRNFLVPQGKAILASARSVAELDHQKRLAAHRREKATEQAQGDKGKIEGLSIVISAKVAPPQLDENGEVIAEVLQKLFGSITSRDIARVLKDSGVKVDHRKVTFEHSIRTVGKFDASIRLNGGISAKLPFWVIPEGAPDIEAEKRRVEAAQEAMRKKAEEAAKLAATKAALTKKEEKPAAPAEGEAPSGDAEAPAEAEKSED